MFRLGRADSEFLQHHRRSADTLGFQVNRHFDPVGDFHKRNILGHPVIFAIESHRPNDRAGTRSDTGNRQVQSFWLGYSPYGEIARDVKSICPSLGDSRRLERNYGKFFDIEEVLVLQLAVLHSTSGVYAVSLDFDIKHARGHVR